MGEGREAGEGLEYGSSFVWQGHAREGCWPGLWEAKVSLLLLLGQHFRQVGGGSRQNLVLLHKMLEAERIQLGRPSPKARQMPAQS